MKDSSLVFKLRVFVSSNFNFEVNFLLNDEKFFRHILIKIKDSEHILLVQFSLLINAYMLHVIRLKRSSLQFILYSHFISSTLFVQMKFYI